jgi:hypothetical protein
MKQESSNAEIWIGAPPSGSTLAAQRSRPMTDAIRQELSLLQPKAASQLQAVVVEHLVSQGALDLAGNLLANRGTQL